MKSRSSRTQRFFALSLVLCILTTSWAETQSPSDRLLIPVKINGKKASLAFDTGANILVLFPAAAQRLRLRTHPQEQFGKLFPFETAFCKLTAWGQTDKVRFAIPRQLEPMRFEAMDGVMPWEIIRENVLMIDALDKSLGYREADLDPGPGWQAFPLETNSILVINLGTKDKHFTALVDTGSPGGVQLAPAQWRAWNKRHPGAPATIAGTMTLSGAFRVGQQMWAQNVSLGQLHMTDVPVSERFIDPDVGDAHFNATLGLDALKRLGFIVNGKRNQVYIKPLPGPAPPFKHNRLGAHFGPEKRSSDELTARVVPNTPAEKADIRDGDILLKINELDVTGWRTNSAVGELKTFWEQPAGTQMFLTLRRAQAKVEEKVILEDILRPPRH